MSGHWCPQEPDKIKAMSQNEKTSNSVVICIIRRINDPGFEPFIERKTRYLYKNNDRHTCQWERLQIQAQRLLDFVAKAIYLKEVEDDFHPDSGDISRVEVLKIIDPQVIDDEIMEHWQSGKSGMTVSVAEDKDLEVDMLFSVEVKLSGIIWFGLVVKNKPTPADIAAIQEITPGMVFVVTRQELGLVDFIHVVENKKVERRRSV